MIREVISKIQEEIGGREVADLTEAEVGFLLEEHNIKVKLTSNEYMCFYSIEVGKAGYGKRRIEALINLLRLRGILENDKLNHPRLEAFLKIEISL